MKYVFVDGYNVISSWPDLARVREYSFETARAKLIDILQNYSVYYDYKIILVFDAHMVKGSIEKKEDINKHISIVFTKEGETADSYIEKSVNNIGRRYEVCVVTSDSLEQQVAFQRGATRMSSMEFYFEVKNTEAKINNKIVRKYSEKRNTVEDIIQKDVLEKLEKLRRSK